MPPPIPNSKQQKQQAPPAPTHTNEVSCKRKRSGSLTSLIKREAEQVETGNRKPTRKKRDATDKAAVSGTVTPVECAIEWPPFFQQLEKLHKAVNLVWTFCSTRKHVATTFDTIKSAVESHTKSPLTIDDLACVVALRPEGAVFAYVDETTLQTELKGSERDKFFKHSRDFMAQGPAPDVSVGGVTGLEGIEKLSHGGQLQSIQKEVLHFQFVDADLKRQVSDKKTGEPTNPSRRLRQEQLVMPVYSQKQMTQLIDRRNAKFKNSISNFINQCLQDNMDPIETILLKARNDFIPVSLLAGEQAVNIPPSSSSLSSSTIPATIPKVRKSIPEIVEELKNSSWYTGQIVPDGHRVFDAQEAVYGHLDFLLSQNLVNAIFNSKGITQFYAHQAEALNHLYAGHNVVVATSTSSGKSLIYQLPVLYELEQDPNSRAMYIFPTKALAQDQKRSLRELLGYLQGLEDTLVETFDGDTPMQDRNQIRDNGRIIFTNPDMLHITILPQEERWRTFLKYLKFVVVDELHYYNGQMGAHVAFIMRRLQRVCAAVGNTQLRFISCSATVSNPAEHFKAIFNVQDVKLIDYDGSPSGRKEFLCWNTPYKDPGDPASGRGDAKLQCARLFCQLILRGVRTIAFCRVRAQCEKLVGAIKQELELLGKSECSNRVMGYRGGYTAQDRRQIEGEMFDGKLLGIVATTALELGIDIGALDCVLTWGFPYTIANLRQQSGRAGRRNRDSLSILVGDSFATDQHYMQNPDELFSKPNSALGVDLENMLVREGHIQCAAFEMPIQPEADKKYFGKDLPLICKERLIGDKAGFYHCHDRFRPVPSRYVAIRDTEDDHFAVIDITHGRNVVLEELEASRAIFTIYDGAIFLHQGNKYLVRDFQPEKGLARVERVKVEWTTVQRNYTDIDPIETEAVKQITGSPSRAFYGTIKVQQNVFGYFKQDKANRILDAVQVDNPPVIRHSKGMWLDVPKMALDILVQHQINVAAAIHAAEHAFMSLMPTYIISTPGDVRTECKGASKEFSSRESQRKRPGRLTFYDSKGGAGGSGINTKAFEFVDLLLKQALERVEACGCHSEGGCFECVASNTCHRANEVMSKAGSRVILRSLLNFEIDVDSLPRGGEVDGSSIETVVLAQPIELRRGGNTRVGMMVSTAAAAVVKRRSFVNEPHKDD